MLSEKFVKKYMRVAKQIAEDNDSCYSRKLGAVIVKVYPDGRSRQVSGGYNGPPRNTPHCDSRPHLRNVFWPQLTPKEKFSACINTIGIYYGDGDEDEDRNKTNFLSAAKGCKTCPRRLIGAQTGERTELCSCEHAERNAIYNAAEDLQECWMFCWCGVPCQDCTKAVINSGIKHVYCLEDDSYGHNAGRDYSFASRWLLDVAGVQLSVYKPEWYLV